MAHEPRVMRVGQYIRKLSLDELRSLFNVVGGTMAVVGPRPALPREVAVHDALALRPLAGKPGLTGLWQISGRSNLACDESMRLDATYVNTWSPVLNLTILLRTTGPAPRRC